MAHSNNHQKDASSLNRTRLGVDLALVSGLGLLLIAIHYLTSGAIKRLLTFYYTEFNVIGLYTSAFVQHTDLQLWGNLLAYLLTVYLIYLLITEADLQQWFRPTFIAIILVLPPLVTLSSYSIYTFAYGLTLPPERGFSGVASGFGGFLFVALIIYLRDSINRELANSLAVSVLLLLLVEIHYIQSRGVDLLVTALAALGIAMMFGLYVWEQGAQLPDLHLSKERLRTVMLSVMAIIVLAALMLGMFPADFLEGTSFTNIIGHGMGFLWGCLVSVITLNWILYRYDGQGSGDVRILTF